METQNDIKAEERAMAELLEYLNTAICDFWESFDESLAYEEDKLSAELQANINCVVLERAKSGLRPRSLNRLCQMIEDSDLGCALRIDFGTVYLRRLAEEVNRQTGNRQFRVKP